MLSRQYDPSRGRWTGVDPLAGFLHDPQSLNRYAYVLNDPVNRTDPLGLTHDCALYIEKCSSVITNGTDDQGNPTSRVEVHCHIEGYFCGGGGGDGDGIVQDGSFGGGGGGIRRSGGASNNQVDLHDLPLNTRNTAVQPMLTSSCPPVPVAPPGVNVNRNIVYAESIRIGTDAAARRAEGDSSFLAKSSWFYGMVRPGGHGITNSKDKPMSRSATSITEP
jgi:hypothetical protein